MLHITSYHKNANLKKPQYATVKMAKIKKTNYIKFYRVHEPYGNCHILLMYNNTTTLEHSSEVLFKAEIFNLSVTDMVHQIILCVQSYAGHCMPLSSLLDLHRPPIVIIKPSPITAKINNS